jgi:hypothetical protein
MQRQENWNIDALISLKNINDREQRILDDQRRELDALRQRHPELDCERLLRNLSELRETNTEERRELLLATVGIQAAASSRGRWA